MRWGRLLGCSCHPARKILLGGQLTRAGSLATTLELGTSSSARINSFGMGDPAEASNPDHGSQARAERWHINWEAGRQPPRQRSPKHMPRLKCGIEQMWRLKRRVLGEAKRIARIVLWCRHLFGQPSNVLRLPSDSQFTSNLQRYCTLRVGPASVLVTLLIVTSLLLFHEKT